MTKTKTYSLTQKEYMKILMLKRFRKSWWLYLLMFLIGFIHIKDFGTNTFSTFVCIFSFIYPLLVFTYLYFWSKSKDHEPVFAEVNLFFDDKYLYFKSNNNESKVAPNSIQKIIEHNKHWLLYISKGQFIHVPKHIFYNESDFKLFTTLIKQNN